MKKIILATSNQGKIKEFTQLLNHLPFEWTAQSELGIPDAPETGLTFVENAIIKARNASKLSGLPALADDSGLVVNCLNGAPGVYSARYAGPNATRDDLIKKLLNEIQKSGSADRSAHYYCVLVLLQYPDDPAPLIAQGIWPGEILSAPKGDHGFGYDPVFFLRNHDCSVAELLPAEKNRISHRSLAIQELKRQLQCNYS
ncbi:MAG: RdgB/HAM1 family non-canonical purine NTP pyrophosphatase [Proteobacteria bacterium]|nr:RdgB/HAM1 family non-canonical purine NTP pyrophosphatase [Pseudomonadota bacterium]